MRLVCFQQQLPPIIYTESHIPRGCQLRRPLLRRDRKSKCRIHKGFARGVI